MIRLSRMADYAVVLMTHMAAQAEDVFTAQSLASQSHLPPPTVAKVMARLARGGLLRSQRGVKGGYRLANSPMSIRVVDIVAALDGPIALTDCLSNSSAPCAMQNDCPSRLGVEKVNGVLRNALSALSLADLIIPARPVSALSTPLQAAQ